MFFLGKLRDSATRVYFLFLYKVFVKVFVLFRTELALSVDRLIHLGLCTSHDVLLNSHKLSL